LKPYEEDEALDNLRKIRRLALRIKDQELLELLARDDQPNNSREPDKVHKAVDIGVCGQLAQAAHALQNAVNICGYLLDTTPKRGRVRTLEDCLACGEPCLPAPKKGLCGECLAEYKRSGKRWQSHGDFVSWKRQQYLDREK